MQIKKINDFTYEIQKSGEMKVPARIFASEKLMEAIRKDDSLKQVVNVAKLPGIIGYSLAMPDMHMGYGFSIGGVAAFELKTGIISPGGVGFDINCGVRVLATDISVETFIKKRKEFLREVKRSIPSGVGRGNKERIDMGVLDEILIKGAEWAVEKGMGTLDDLNNTEENGRMKDANPQNVSQRAKARGRPQIGTLGAGNHFLEIQKVEKIFDKQKAKKFGLEENKVVVMIHCGSRGLGHQVASDYIQSMEKEFGFPKFDRQLVYAPLSSELGKRYLSAMNCAVNFAFCNRQIIMYKIQRVLKEIFPRNKTHLVYDVAHNIAKIEEHVVNGKRREICVHRKGATRAFEGEPVIIPGSMGTASYVLVGGAESEGLAWGSTAHGAGRIMSRTEAMNTLNIEKIKKSLKEKDIEIEAGSEKGILEEAPEVYKAIEDVIEVSDILGLTKRVARLIPLAVIKG